MRIYRGELPEDVPLTSMPMESISAVRRACESDWDDVFRTRLRAPLEFVHLHFFISGVTRSLTHQMVRQRTAVYAQESLRFAVKELSGDTVALPPSLRGLPEDHAWMTVWDKAQGDAQLAYRALVDAGMPAEDARGLLPHNVRTRLHYATNLRNLLEHVGNRMCTQAQFEWRELLFRMREALLGLGGWQWEAVADKFAPICYDTGKCEFDSATDRSCSIRSRVKHLGDLLIPSAQWATYGSGTSGNSPSRAWAIHPAEWLADPAAARMAPGDSDVG
jgi:flavin-dependent thymidylate synthase